jgi:hypothetical protein
MVLKTTCVQWSIIANAGSVKYGVGAYLCATEPVWGRSLPGFPCWGEGPPPWVSLHSAVEGAVGGWSPSLVRPASSHKVGGLNVVL